VSDQTQTLGVTDRSRFAAGMGRCPRLRYLEYHSGPDGYGQKRKSTSIPLATGGRCHEAITDSILSTDHAKSIRGAVAKYKREAAAGGLSDLLAPIEKAELQWLIDEQACLIEGMAWGFMLHIYPWIQSEFTILHVEHEEELVLGCTCGLDEAGTPEDHQARACEGTVLTTRPDMILRAKSDNTLCILDLKTAGGINASWRRQWEDEVKQLGLGAAVAEIRMGEPIHHAYIIGLNKGPRPHSYNQATGLKDGPKRQDSRFCYAYYRPAGPPFEQEDWKTSYHYKDEDGKNRQATKSKGYEKIALWEADLGKELGDQSASIEYWVKHKLSTEEIKSQYEVVGPLPIARHLVKHLKAALGPHEAEWRKNIYTIWAACQANAPGSDEWMEVLDELCPQSWECYRYSGYCAYREICKESVGWRGFFTGEHEGYGPRRPHHAREMAEGTARGVVFPSDFGEEDEG